MRDADERGGMTTTGADVLFAGDESSALSLRGISMRFGSLVALSDITLTVPASQRHAILGANGAGKTTLFNCITGDVAPSEGRIRLFSEDITALPTHQRIRRGLRRTYQTSLVLPNLSVLDNLFLAEQGVQPRRQSPLRLTRNNPHRTRARELAEFVGLEAWQDSVADNLSHGQKRQLEIGMALAGQPRLILFDEPAAGLSQAEREHLKQILLELPRSITFVLIEHDLEVALGVADHITVLHQGMFFTSGTPAEIEADEGVQQIYLGGDHG